MGSLYFLFTHKRIIVARLLILLPFATLLFAIYAPSYFGGLSLRILGIGGGIPISLITKTMPPGSKDMIASVKRGCLVLKTATEIVVKPDDKPTPEKCHLQLFPSSDDESQSRPTVFNQVEVYPFSQIIQIDRLLSSD